MFVTGASSGLGLELAVQLVRDHGAHVILVARREDRLAALAERLERDFGGRAEVVAADLTQPADLQRAFAVATDGRELRGAILNAGVTYFGDAVAQPTASLDALVGTNVTSVAALALRFADHLRRGAGGHLMLVSSMGGFSPLPFQTAYGASKAFVTSFGRGLAYELRGTPVRVTVFAPGGIATELMALSGLDRGFKPGDAGIMAVDDCARRALTAMARGDELAIPGAANTLMALGMKLAPHSLVTRVIARIYRRALVGRE